MSFPIISSYGGIPALEPYQFYFQGQTFGVGSNGVNWKEIDGLDIENIRTGDSGRPRDQGEFIGYDFLAGRDITLKFDCQATGDTTLQENLLTLSSAFGPQANIETPLFFSLPYWETLTAVPPDTTGTLACMARPRNRSWKIDITYSLGNLAQDLQVMLHATDPRFYGPTQELRLGLGEEGEFLNAGNFDCRPVFYITGPATNPGVQVTVPPPSPGADGSVSLLGWGNGDGADAFTLLPYQYILVDCYYQTALLYSAANAVTTKSTMDGRPVTDYDPSRTLGALYTTLETNESPASAGFPTAGIFNVSQSKGGLATLSYDGFLSAPTLGFDNVVYMTSQGNLCTGGLIGSGWTKTPLSYALTAGSTWPVLFPGTSRITDNSLSGTAYLGVDWASAWLL
jgi:hypothetical protein